MVRPAFLLPRGRLGRPLILGHRGASAEYPENTILAFREAMRAGADGVELDVMRCGSGEVVVIHDDDMHRVASKAPGSERSPGPFALSETPPRHFALRDLSVRETPLSVLRCIDLGQGQVLPTLEEVLEELGPAALVNVELKSPEVKGREHIRLFRDDGLAEAVTEVLRRAGRLSGSGAAKAHGPEEGRGEATPGTTLVSSFDPMQLLRFRRHAAGVPMGYLFHSKLSRPLRDAWPAWVLRPAALHPEAALVDAVAMRRWRKAGYAVHVWTVDDLREVASLAALGVDGIITNTPGVLRKLWD